MNGLHFSEPAEGVQILPESHQDLVEESVPHVHVNSGSLEIIKNMVRNGQSAKQIATAVGISTRSAFRWKREVEIGPECIPTRKGRPLKDTTMLEREIESILAADCSTTGKGLSEKIPVNLTRSPSTICRQLKKMKYSRKRMRPVVAGRNSEPVVAEREIYCQRIADIPDTDLIFLDETGFNLHACPHFGYAPIGTTPWINIPTQRGRNVSCIAAVSIAGIISYAITDGAFNTAKMLEWLQQGLIPSLNSARRMVVMDNARFHHAAIVVDTLREAGLTPTYLPPYSPQLNPIEEFFSALKTRYTSVRPRPMDNASLKSALSCLLDISTNEQMQGYYAHMRQWVTMGQQRGPFV